MDTSKLGFRGRLRYDRDLGKVVPVTEKEKKVVNAPVVIVDEVEPFMSHADGQMYTSKRKYRRSLREQGYIEVGTEKIKPWQRPEVDRDEIREDVKEAERLIKYGMAPLSERDKEKLKREEEAWNSL
jgi:hypothetical protein